MQSDLIVNGEILLYGSVGDPWGWGDGFTPADVAKALAEIGDGDVTVRINSGGGIATDGMAIYSLLKAHVGKVTAVVDGVAASAASLIYMAGAVREMRDGAVLMIHDPSAITLGTPADHRKSFEWLDKLADQYAGVYSRASKRARDDVREIMREETWFTAAEAVANGFSTGVLDEAATEATAFDYRIYLHAPDTLPVRAAEPRVLSAALAFSQANLAKARRLKDESAELSSRSDGGTSLSVMKGKSMDNPTGAAAAENAVKYDSASALASAYPDFAASLRADGAKAERERILGIEAVAPSGHAALVAEMKADGKTSPEAAALRILKAEKEARAQQHQAVQDVEAETSALRAAPAASAAPAKNMGSTPDEWKAAYAASADLQAEFPDAASYAAYMGNRHKVRVLGRNMA